MSVTLDSIKRHFISKRRVRPTVEHALGFITTESGEVWELWLSQFLYVRNHPENKEEYSPERFAEELADIVYMCVIAGWMAQVDVIDTLEKKLAAETK